MKKHVILLFLLGTVINSNGIELRRDLDVIPFLGTLTTHNFLTTPNQTQVISGLTIYISAFSHIGYFVEGFIGPSQHRTIQITTRPDGTFNIWGYTDSYIAVLSAGPFVQYNIKSATLGYRIGYAAAGDGRRGTEMFTHGITLTRLFQKAWVMTLDVQQFSKDWNAVGISYSIGVGKRF